MSQLPDQTIDPLPPEPELPAETPPVEDVAPDDVVPDDVALDVVAPDDVAPPAQEVSGAKWYTMAFLAVISLLSLGGFVLLIWGAWRLIDRVIYQ